MAGDASRVFTPSGLSGEVADGTTVLDAARQLGVDLDSVCGGRGICGRCQVVPSIGTFAKWNITTTGSELDGWSALERDYRGGRPIGAGHRLGCAASIHGDVVIDVPAASQVHRQVVRKELRQLDLPRARRRPAVRPALRRGAPAELGSGLSAAELLATAVADQHGERRHVGRRVRAAGPPRGDRRRHGDSRRPRRPDRRRLAGLRRRGLRRRRRRRLDDHRRSPLRPVRRRRARQRRADEPADPLRRGPDEPGVVRDDEPRRRSPADVGRARGDRRADRRAARRRRRRDATGCSTS